MCGGGGTRSGCGAAAAMVKLTMIARVRDGLPLAEGLDTEGNSRDLEPYKQQVKTLLKKLAAQSPAQIQPRQSYASGPFCFHYLVASGVVFVALCEKVSARTSAQPQAATLPPRPLSIKHALRPAVGACLWKSEPSLQLPRPRPVTPARADTVYDLRLCVRAPSPTHASNPLPRPRRRAAHVSSRRLTPKSSRTSTSTSFRGSSTRSSVGSRSSKPRGRTPSSSSTPSSKRCAGARRCQRSSAVRLCVALLCVRSQRSMAR